MFRGSDPFGGGGLGLTQADLLDERQRLSFVPQEQKEQKRRVPDAEELARRPLVPKGSSRPLFMGVLADKEILPNLKK